MKCSICGISNNSNFKCRNANEPFHWFCIACYDDKYVGSARAQQIEHPILCIACKELPASMRSKAQDANQCQAWKYWCHLCYERTEHKDDPHIIHDLDSASDPDDCDSDSHDFESQCDEEHTLDEHAEHDQEDAGSLCSWQKEDDAFSLSSWQDTTSCASFQLSYEHVNLDDDVASNQSFQMVDVQHQHQHQHLEDDVASNQSFEMVGMQHQQFEDQQDQLEAEPQQQQHQQLEEQQQQQEQQQEQQEQQLAATPALVFQPGAMHPQFGEWQEDEELALAIAMTLHGAQIRDAELASSSSNSSSSHSKSSAATTPAISVAKKKKESFIVKKKKDEEKLATIQEENFNISQYVGTSGCMETFFTADEEDGSCMVCPDHGLNHQPHCRHCANHQHMVLKHKHDVAQHTVILASLQSGEITWVERYGKLWATCSKHSHHDMQENCSACLQIVEMLDDGSCVKPIGDAPA